MDLYPYREQMKGMWNEADNTKQVICQHTTESEGGNTNVIDYLERNWGKGSYQTMVDFDGEEVRLVPDNKQAWGAMPKGNRIGLHVCAMGRADWSRDRWMREAKLLERTAMRYAQWHQAHGIPLVKINGDQVRAGVRGVCGHIEIRDAFGESDHWDPGYNFPYDVVIARAKDIVAGATTPTPDAGGFLMALTDAEQRRIYTELTQRYPSRSKYRTDDTPVDTLAGFILNLDARVHEDSVERDALRGVASAINLVKREAANGDPTAQAVLAEIGGK